MALSSAMSTRSSAARASPASALGARCAAALRLPACSSCPPEATLHAQGPLLGFKTLISLAGLRARLALRGRLAAARLQQLPARGHPARAGPAVRVQDPD